MEGKLPEPSDYESIVRVFKDKINNQDTLGDRRYLVGERIQNNHSSDDISIVEQACFNVSLANEQMEQLMQHKDKHIEKFEGLQLIHKYYRGMVIGQFSWESVTSDDQVKMRRITEFKDLTCKKLGKLFCYLLSNSSFYQENFPLPLLATYMSNPYTISGIPCYDSTLRLQSDLTQIFMVFHLMSDWRFAPKIDGEHYKITEPLSRINLRINNKANEKLMNKYFNKNFNLKKFVYSLYENFFPNVNWRYIGAGHIMHRLTLEITEYMFRLGLWELEDLEVLLRTIQEKTENILTLQDSCVKDYTNSRISEGFVNTLVDMFQDVKEYLSLIMLHTVALINDNSLDRSLEFGNNAKKLNEDNYWRGAYFSSHKENNIQNQIIMKYLMIEHTFDPKDISKRIKNPLIIENIDKLITMISDVEQDFFYNSMDLTTPYIIDWYYGRHSSKKNIQAEALSIKNECIALIDNIMRGKIEKVNQIDLTKVVDDKIVEFLNKLKTTLDLYKAKNTLDKFQMALSELNFLDVLFTLTTIIIGFKKTEFTDGVNPLLMVIQQISLICENNFINQSALFMGDSGRFFYQLNVMKPFAGIIACRYIFKKNSTVLYVGPDVFEVIMHKYNQISTDFFSTGLNVASLIPKGGENAVYVSDSEETRRFNMMMALYSYNLFLEEVINIHKVSSIQSRQYDLEVQAQLIDIIAEHVLPLLEDSSNWKLNEGYVIDNNLKDVNLKMMEGVFMDFIGDGGDNLINLENNKTFGKGTVISYLFELCYSLLKMFNKMTNRLIFVGKYDEIYNIMTNFSKFHYLAEFVEGVPMLTELTRLYTNFMIFRSNSLIGLDRHSKNKDPGIVYLEKYIPDFDKDSYVPDYFKSICEILKEKETVANDNLSLKTYLKELLYKGLFQGIYKYVKAIISLYYPDIKRKNMDDLGDLHERIKTVFEIMKQYSPVFINYSDNKFWGKQTIEEYTTRIITEITFEEKDAMEVDEILYLNMYDMRVRGQIIIHAIEQSLPEDLLYIIENYVRRVPTSAPRIDLYFKGGEKDKKLKQVSSEIPKTISSMERLSSKKEENPTPPVLSSYLLKQYTHLKHCYREKKDLWLSKPNDSNILVRFLSENKFNIKGMIDYCFNSIHERMIKSNESRLKNKDILIQEFLKYEPALSYITFISNMVGSFIEFKKELYDMTIEDNSLWKKNKAKDNEDEEENKKVEPEEADNNVPVLDIYSLIYTLMIQFRQILTFKTYQDNDWDLCYRYFYLLSDFFKNCCENNYLEFKRFFNDFTPRVEYNGITIEGADLGTRNLFFEYYVRLESGFNTSLVWTRRESDICTFDRPETFMLRVRDFEIQIEFLNGPCPENQRQIYRYRSDLWNGIIERIVNDIDSDFYRLKDATLTYITSLIEGEGDKINPKTEKTLIKLHREGSLTPKLGPTESLNKYLITEFFAKNFGPQTIYNVMYAMLKRLALKTLLEEDIGLRKKLMAQVAKLKIDEIIADNGKITADEQKYITRRYLNGLDVNNNPIPLNKLIDDDMLGSYSFKSYKQLMSLYMNHLELAEHPIISSCLKLFTLLEAIAERIGPFKTFLVEKKVTLYNIYRNKVDLDDQVSDDVKRRDNTMKEEHTEDLTFFMFLTKILRKVEIVIGEEKEISKVVSFIRMPQTFYLEEKIKERFYDEVDLDSKKLDFLRNMELFFLEIENNFLVGQFSGIIYELTNNDSFELLKFIMWYIGFAINAVCIYSYELDSNPIMGDRRLEAGNYQYGITLASSIFAAINFILFFIWFASRYWLMFLAKKKEYQIRRGASDKEMNSPKTILKVAILDSFFRQSAPLNFFLHFLFAILGISLNPFFHTLQLLLVTNISKTARYILKATLAHFDQLVMTFLFAFFLIYSFSTLNANYYSDSFENKVDYCISLRSCFVYMLNLGLRNGGGIADSESLYEFKDSKYPLKTVFDLSFFIIINLISLNIIFGIIIDTFGELRGKIIERSRFDN